MMKFILFVFVGLFVSIGVRADEDCGNYKLALQLWKLQSVGRIHNCQIEVLAQRHDEGMAFSVYAKDTKLCDRFPLSCPEAYWETFVPKKCGVFGSEDLDFFVNGEYSFGIKLPSKDMRYFLRTSASFNGGLLGIVVGKIDLMDISQNQVVHCQRRADPPGGLM